MEWTKKVFLLFAVAVSCAVFVWLDNGNMFFGKTIDRFFPCVQNIGDSFPCYGVYDLAAMLVALVGGSLSLLAAIYYLIRQATKK